MKKTGAFLVALACSLVLPGIAGAAVTLGPASPNPNPATAQALNFAKPVLLFTASGPASAQLTAPSAGVITGWQFYTDDVNGEGVTAQLRTLTPSGPKTYVVSGGGAVEPIAPVDASGATEKNVQHTFSAQLPISAGQMVGVTVSHPEGTAQARVVLPAEEGMGWEFGCLGAGCGHPEPVLGTPELASQVPNQWLALNARVEPDVDHDGLGDETQDTCVGACQPPAPAPAKKKCRKGKKLKHGKCVKKHKKHHKHHKHHG